MKKRIALILAAALAVGSLTGCGKKESGQEIQQNAGDVAAEQNGKKTVNIALTVDMGDMAPFAPPSSGRNYLRYSVYDYLAVFREFGQSWEEMDWQLAKNIEQLDDVTYEIELYDYIKDAIGNPIAASDVVWCINSYMESGNMPRLVKYVKDVEETGDYTLKITLNTTAVGALEYLFAQVGVVSQKTYEEHKDTMSTTPITSGAYQIAECVSGSQYVLEKNENYWQTDETAKCYTANQQVDQIIYNVVKEPAQVTISLQTGENDMATVLAQSELAYFYENGAAVDGYHVSEMAGGTSNTLHFNCSEGSMFADNLALRQAVLYAFDAQAIVDGAYKGNGEVIHDLATNLCSDYNEEWDAEDYYDYNPELAKQKLQEAGYKDGVDPATGKPLVLRLMCDTEHKDAAVIMQSYLIAAGLDCQLLVYDNALAASYIFDPSAFDLVLTYHGSEGNVTAVYDLMCAENTDGIATRFFNKDEKLQELLMAATNASTHNAETVEALHDYVYEQAYAVGVNVTYSYAVSNDQIGIVRHPWGQLIGSACDYTNLE